jgi:hypothetical protein
MANIEIRVASFAEAMELKNAIAAVIAKGGVDISGLPTDENSIKKLMSSEVADVAASFFEPLIKALSAVDSDPRVYKAAFKCLRRCSYDGEMITENTFEDEDARGDYYMVMIDCLKVNLVPFFKGLLSGLKASQNQKNQHQE